MLTLLAILDVVPPPPPPSVSFGALRARAMTDAERALVDRAQATLDRFANAHTEQELIVLGDEMLAILATAEAIAPGDVESAVEIVSGRAKLLSALASFSAEPVRRAAHSARIVEETAALLRRFPSSARAHFLAATINTDGEQSLRALHRCAALDVDGTVGCAQRYDEAASSWAALTCRAPRKLFLLPEVLAGGALHHVEVGGNGGAAVDVRASRKAMLSSADIATVTLDASIEGCTVELTPTGTKKFARGTTELSAHVDPLTGLPAPLRAVVVLDGHALAAPIVGEPITAGGIMLSRLASACAKLCPQPTPRALPKGLPRHAKTRVPR